MFFDFLFKPKKYLERRRSYRKHTRNLVSVELPQRYVLNLRNLVSVELPQRCVLTLSDISEGGLQFSSPKPLKKNQVINLTVNLAEIGAKVEVAARVVWNKTFSETGAKVYRVGVSFLDLSQEALKVIRQFAVPSFRAA